MNRRFRCILAVLLLTLPLAACRKTEPAETAAPTETPAAVTPVPRPDAGEVYADILENCRAVLYDEWERPLTADDLTAAELCPLMLELGADRDSFGYYLRDINGDGLEELFLGLDEPERITTLYEVFTLQDGSPASIYTVTGGDALYLCRDNTLLQEGAEPSGRVYLQRYALTPDGLIEALGGLTYDPANQSAPCVSLGADGTQTPLSDADFLARAQDWDAMREHCRFSPVRDWNGRINRAAAETVVPAAARPTVYAAGPGYYTRSSLYDGQTGVRAVDLLLPSGWDARLTVDWGCVSTATPGLASLSLTSPDGRTAIRLLSEREYLDLTENGQKRPEGPDTEKYRTLRQYCDAESVQPLLLREAGFIAAEPLRSLPIPEALWETARTMAATMAENARGSLGSEGSVARNLYKSGDTLIECLTLVTAVESYDLNGRSDTDTVTWRVPLACLLTADSEEGWAEVHDLFETVCANFGFTADFAYLNTRFGAEITALLESGRLSDAEALLRDSTGDWLRDYAASPAFASGVWPARWRGLLGSGTDYRTTDGGTLRAGSPVFQNGSLFFFGADRPAGDGWTALSPAA